ncbi:unnamed protein product [Prorocentrum cordatum]|uniref:SHSP domain-containing protein n=1 Tax=Prorocentrum cordatum TaxID=2364126 RepID=A0ABN9TQ63_9DINO|nr:unnamed protein product [Polarella glacialis]
MPAAPRPRAALPLALLLALAALPGACRAEGAGGPTGQPGEAGGPAGLGLSSLAARAQRLQAGLASGLQGLQDRVAGLQAPKSSGAQWLTEPAWGLSEKLARLRSQLVEECEYWDRKTRESWQDSLALLRNATRAAEEVDEPQPTCASWDCWELVRANLSSAGQRLQEELAARAADLQARLAQAQAGGARALQTLRGGLPSSCGLHGRLAWLQGQFEEEVQYWGQKFRECWWVAASSWHGRHHRARGDVEASSEKLGYWGQRFPESWRLAADAWLGRHRRAEGDTESSSDGYWGQKIRESWRVAADSWHGRYRRAEEEFGHWGQKYRESWRAAADSWLGRHRRAEEEFGHWGQKFRESWWLAAASSHGRHRRAGGDTETSEESPDWRRELVLARKELTSWRGVAEQCRRRAGELEGELGAAREAAAACEDAARESRTARLEGGAARARQPELSRGEELSTHRTAHEQEVRMLRETLRWALRAREDEAGQKQQCEERLVKERKATDGEAAQIPGAACAWGCLCACALLLRLPAPRSLRAKPWCGRRSPAQVAQDEFDSKFPSDVRDEAQADGVRRRVLEIQCRDVQHEDISVEAVCNGCVVAIAHRDAASGQPAEPSSRLFQWQLSEGLFSLADELARFEDGVLHLVLRESLPQGRAVRLPQHFSLEDEDTCSDSSWLGQEESEASGDHSPEDTASLDSFEASFEKVDEASDGMPPPSDGEEGSQQDSSDKGPP